MVAHTILQVATEEQKRTYLPAILWGEMLIALGYTEPDSGSDVAAAKTTAVRVAGNGPRGGATFYSDLLRRPRARPGPHRRRPVPLALLVPVVVTRSRERPRAVCAASEGGQGHEDRAVAHRATTRGIVLAGACHRGPQVSSPVTSEGSSRCRSRILADLGGDHRGRGTAVLR